MKKVITLMLGLVAGTASFAQTPASSTPQTRVLMTTDQKIKLFVQPLPTNGQIELSDAAGHPLYAETVGLQKGFGQQFDISNLAAGTYNLTLKTDKQTVVTKTFVVQANPNQNFVILQS